MNRFERMQTFTLVAESHSFAEVACKMKVTTAAVSKQMLLLETHLGLQLLNRSTRSQSVSLTDAGKVYYHHCKRIIADVLDSENIVANMKDEPTGLLRVVVFSDFTEHFIIPHLKDYLKLYPKLNVYIEMSDQYPNFDRQDVDVFVGAALVSPPELSVIDLFKSRHVTLASPAYLQTAGEPLTPRELRHHCLINHTSRDDVFLFKHDESLKLKTTLQFNTMQGLLSAVNSGLGVAQVSDFIARPAIKSGQLKEVLSAYRESLGKQCVFYRQTNSLQAKVKSFLEFIKKVSSER